MIEVQSYGEKSYVIKRRETYMSKYIINSDDAEKILKQTTNSNKEKCTNETHTAAHEKRISIASKKCVCISVYIL